MYHLKWKSQDFPIFQSLNDRRSTGRMHKTAFRNRSVAWNILCEPLVTFYFPIIYFLLLSFPSSAASIQHILCKVVLAERFAFFYLKVYPQGTDALPALQLLLQPLGFCCDTPVCSGADLWQLSRLKCGLCSSPHNQPACLKMCQSSCSSAAAVLFLLVSF